MLFYDGPKGILILVFLSLLIEPASVTGLKATTNVACPSALMEFGGEIPYVGLLQHYSSAGRPAQRQNCFPAAHASGGFALLALFFLFKSPRNRRRAIYVALGAGWLMGAYKMAIGDHFVSHMLVSMLWAWFVINIIVVADNRLTRSPVSSSWPVGKGCRSSH